MEEELKKDGRGGARPGSGRKKGINKPYVHFTVTFPSEYKDKIKLISEKKGVSASKLLQSWIDEELDE